MQKQVAFRRQRESGPITRIMPDRLPEQIECRDYVFFFPSVNVRESPQIQIVGGQVARRPFGGTADLSHLQCRLYYTSNAGSDFVLKLEDILKGTIKAVSPEMRTTDRLD